MTEFEYGPIGDVQLDSLLQETQEMIQGNNDFLLPDEMVSDAIHRACDFFNLPDAPFIGDTSVCVWTKDTDTAFDDVFGFSRQQMMEMGISGEDALTLVYTHECAHRALQDNDTLTGKEQELACDFFAGIHAGVEDIDVRPLMNALGNTVESDSHPSGEIRVAVIDFGKKTVEEMQEQGTPLTFENCMERFEDFLCEHNLSGSLVASASSHNLTHGEDISFGSGWSADEYAEKAKNCYKEADYYEQKAVRCEDPDDIRHNLNEAKKWRERGDEYMQKAEYADK
ncbi:MAG: hypothetical protein ACLTSL_06610 [Odoribacter splanchnicus]